MFVDWCFWNLWVSLGGMTHVCSMCARLNQICRRSWWRVCLSPSAQACSIKCGALWGCMPLLCICPLVGTNKQQRNRTLQSMGCPAAPAAIAFDRDNVIVGSHCIFMWLVLLIVGLIIPTMRRFKGPTNIHCGLPVPQLAKPYISPPVVDFVRSADCTCSWYTCRGSSSIIWRSVAPVVPAEKGKKYCADIAIGRLPMPNLSDIPLERDQSGRQ